MSIALWTWPARAAKTSAMRLTLFAAAVAAIAIVAGTPALTKTAAPADPYLWLEQMQSPRALAWVEKENARSLAVIVSPLNPVMNARAAIGAD